MTEIALFLSAVSQVSSVSKALLHAHTQAEKDAIRLELTGVLLDMQAKVSEIQASYQKLLEANKDLYKKVSAYERWESERARYELKQLFPGMAAYTLKPDHAATEPPHWLCPDCYGNSKKSFFSPTGADGTVWRCNACNLSFHNDSHDGFC